MRIPVLIATAVAMVLCVASFAGATMATWSFDTVVGSGVATGVVNPWGVPTAAVNVDPDSGTGWYDAVAEYGTAQGWWDIGLGTIVLTIPGAADPIPAVAGDIQVEVTYWMDLSMAPVVEISPAATFLSKDTELVEVGPVMGGWYKDIWKWSLPQAVAPLTITVKGDVLSGSQIDKISIVPEPSGMIALFTGVMGLAGLVARRRRA